MAGYSCDDFGLCRENFVAKKADEPKIDYQRQDVEQVGNLKDQDTDHWHGPDLFICPCCACALFGKEGERLVQDCVDDDVTQDEGGDCSGEQHGGHQYFRI